jgi:hypothetical protein
MMTETILERLLRPEETPQDGINCLRCRHCRPLAHTDFSVLLSFSGGKVALNKEAPVAIHCAKSGRNRPANIFGACQVADPSPQYANRRRVGGDATHHASEIERMFYRALYAHWPRGHTMDLCALVSRGLKPMHKIASNLGVARPLDFDMVWTRTQASLRARRANGGQFNEAQSKYVCDRQRRGDWPSIGGQMKGENYQRRLALQKEIVEAVAALGPRWTWRQITVHVHTVSPASRRKERRRHPRKFLTGARG